MFHLFIPSFSMFYLLIPCGKSIPIIIIIISNLKPIFLYRGLGLPDKSSSKVPPPPRTAPRTSRTHSKLLSATHQHPTPAPPRPARPPPCNNTQPAHRSNLAMPHMPKPSHPTGAQHPIQALHTQHREK